ncbi:MAG: response regulator [Planctomycetes bacterium]|nr:response regulator [Planctomycetota bacterium]
MSSGPESIDRLSTSRTAAFHSDSPPAAHAARSLDAGNVNVTNATAGPRRQFAAAVPAIAAGGAPATATAGSDRARRVLLVGRDSASTTAVSEQLALLGNAVEVAAGGAQALRHLEHAIACGANYDAVFIAPDTHGIDAVLFVGRMKAIPAIAPLPVLLVADPDSRLTRAAAVELGFDGTVQTPLSAARLEQCFEKTPHGA